VEPNDTPLTIPQSMAVRLRRRGLPPVVRGIALARGDDSWPPELTRLALGAYGFGDDVDGNRLVRFGCHRPMEMKPRQDQASSRFVR